MKSLLEVLAQCVYCITLPTLPKYDLQGRFKYGYEYVQRILINLLVAENILTTFIHISTSTMVQGVQEISRMPHRLLPKTSITGGQY